MNINKIFRKIIFAVVVSCIYAFSLSAQINVTGVVTDNTGSPVPGVNVIVKGTTTGVVTEGNGRYAITVPSGDAVLIFSFVGFATQEIAVSNRSSIDVFMAEDSQEIDEVVVVGYGTQRKSDVTGSVAVVKPEDIQRTSSFSALDGLKGVASGVNVFLNSGMPGGTMRVVIRGQSSIQAYAEPLYVVDGVVMSDFQFLNPNDIERMEVLKDASSAAIYGARGAQGVILVTTKRGSQDGRTRVSYQGWVGLSTMARKMDVLNAKDYMTTYRLSLQNAVKYGGYDEEYVTNRWTAIAQNSRLNPNYVELFRINGTFNPEGWKDINDNTLEPIYDTDWQDETTRNALSHSHQLGIQSGSKKSSTGVFLNYTDNQGLLNQTWLKRVSTKVTYDTNPLSWLSTAVNLTVNHTWQKATPISSGGMDALRSGIEFPTIFPVKLPNGEWSDINNGVSGFGFEAIPNPAEFLATREQMRYRTQIFGNAALTFHLAEGLDLKTQFGAEGRLYRWTDHEAFGNPGADNGGKGRVILENFSRLYWQEETYLNYNKVWDRHRFNGMIGLSWSESTYAQMRNDVGNFITNAFGVHNISSGTEQNTQNSTYERWAMNSYFTRLAYTFSDKYMATFTARMDGSSKFGANNKYAFFPSGGLGWMISNEDFMQNASWIDQLKLHTSYGITGNSELPMYRSLAVYGLGTTLLNGSRAPSGNASRLANEDLRWEKTKQFDIGFNLNTLGNRLNFDVSWYYKYTDDLLLDAPIPITSGFNSITKNVGAVSNRGWDILISGMPVQKPDFEWTVSLNANYNANRVERLNENNADVFVGDGWLAGQSIIMRVGEPLACFWGLERIGIKDAAYVAANGGRVGTALRSAERTILGKGMPDWTGSFMNRFRYKNFDFLAELQFVVGGNIRYDATHTTEDRFALTSGLTSILTEAWEEGDPTNVPNSVQAIRNAQFDGQDSTIDSKMFWSASYLRGSLFELGYNFNTSQIQFMDMTALRAYFSVRNAFVICDPDFKAYDPEVSTRGAFEQNVMNYQYPVPRIFTFGVNVTF